MPTLAENRKARADYHELESFEAGLKLTGPEVRAAKGGRLNLTGSYVTLDQQNQAWLLNTYIAPYPPAAGQQQNYQPDRSRRLLLRKRELRYLAGKKSQGGLTILPISVYTKGSFIKVKLILAKGKKQFDKRSDLKKRDLDKQIRQSLKTRRNA